MDSRISMDQEETSTLVERKSNPDEWTHERHCLFLKSMETTFVEQLYKSLDLSSWHSHKNASTGSKSSKHKLNSIRASSGQFKVLRDGSWSKLDFRGDEQEVDEPEESKVPFGNSWVQHHRNSKIQSGRRSAVPVKSPLADTENQNTVSNPQLWRQDSVDSSEEATGQNFDDEALEEERYTRISNMKTNSSDTESINDQVLSSESTVPENENDVEDHDD